MPLLFAGQVSHTLVMDHTHAPRAPTSDTIAGFVKVQRVFFGWKQGTLATLAGVSLSTVERVERGEAVRASSLEKLALTLSQSRDAFTAPRVPLSDEEAAAVLVESFSWMEGRLPVAVAPLRQERQLRDLASTDLAIVTSDLGEDAGDDVDSLREWLDLTSFVRAEDGTLMPKRERTFRLRRLYKEVLDAVSDLERRHKAVCLAGTYEAKSSMPVHERVRVAVIAVRSRERNPACVKIERLMADETIDMRAAMQSYFDRID